MRSPRPFGLLNKGHAPTERDMAFIKYAVSDLCNFKELSNLESLQRSHALPDGGNVIIQHMGGILKVVTDKPAPEHEEDDIDERVMQIPMLFSGAFYEEGGGGAGSITVTNTTRRRLVHYDENKTAPEKYTLERFKIWNQYTRCPTMHSGAMAEVVQIVNGYGRQDFANLPKDNKWERITMELPLPVARAIKNELGDSVLPAYKGEVPPSGVCQYRCEFNETDFVCFSDNNSPWLVRISIRDGVIAMPLPLIPATTTKAFRQYVTEKRDDEILKILDRFGGMPSGEGFPSNSQLYVWETSGAVVRLSKSYGEGSPMDFYRLLGLYEFCSWSCNSRGTQAVNTAYKKEYAYSNGAYNYMMQKVYFYKADISCGDLENRGWTSAKKATFGSEAQNKMAVDYIDAVVEIAEKELRRDLVVYKIRRADAETILRRAEKFFNGEVSAREEYNHWAYVEMDKIAECSFSLNEESSGFIFDKHLHGARYNYWNILLTPSGAKTAGGLYIEKHPRAFLHSSEEYNKITDTVLFAYFQKDKLRKVRFFNEWSKKKIRKTSGELTVSTLPPFTMGSFYIEENVVDARVVTDKDFSKTNYWYKEFTHGEYIGSNFYFEPINLRERVRMSISCDWDTVESKQAILIPTNSRNYSALINLTYKQYRGSSQASYDAWVQFKNEQGNWENSNNFGHSLSSDEIIEKYGEYNPENCPKKGYYLDDVFILDEDEEYNRRYKRDPNTNTYRPDLYEFQEKGGGVVIDSPHGVLNISDGRPDTFYMPRNNINNIGEARVVENMFGSASFFGYLKTAYQTETHDVRSGNSNVVGADIPHYFMGVVNE